MDRWEEQPLLTATFMFIKSAARTIPEEDFASHWSQVRLVVWVALCDWPSKNSVFHFLGREEGVYVAAWWKQAVLSCGPLICPGDGNQVQRFLKHVFSRFSVSPIVVKPKL